MIASKQRCAENNVKVSFTLLLFLSIVDSCLKLAKLISCWGSAWGIMPYFQVPLGSVSVMEIKFANEHFLKKVAGRTYVFIHLLCYGKRKNTLAFEQQIGSDANLKHKTARYFPQ